MYIYIFVGKRAVFLSPGRSGTQQSDRDSASATSKGSLFCVPVDSQGVWPASIKPESHNVLTL